MIAHLVLGVLCLLLIFIIPNKKTGLLWSFIAITIFLGIRYMWGNDYPGYLQMYFDYNNHDFSLSDIEHSGATRENHEFEFGWLILNRFFGEIGLGFFGLVMTLTVFESWAMYRVISKFVSPRYYWVAILLFLFSSQFCINASMMRQYLCICMYMFVVELMTEKRVKGYLFWSIGIILLGVTFHQSNALLLLSLPLYYIHVKEGTKSNKWLVVISVSVLFVLWNIFIAPVLKDSLFVFLESSNDDAVARYSSYMDNSLSRTDIGALFQYVLFATWLWMLPQFDKNKQTIIILGLFSFFIESAFLGTGLGRINVYFTMLNMVTWSWFLQTAKKNYFIPILFVIQVLLTLRSLIGFYNNGVWVSSFLYYQTIFDAGSWY